MILMGDDINTNIDDTYSIGISVNMDMPKINKDIQDNLNTLKNLYININDINITDNAIRSLQNRLHNVNLDINSSVNISNGNQVVNQANNIANNVRNAMNNSFSNIQFDKRFQANFVDFTNTITGVTSRIIDADDIINKVKRDFSSFGSTRITNKVFNENQLTSFVLQISQLNNGLEETRDILVTLDNKTGVASLNKINTGSERFSNEIDRINAKATSLQSTLNSIRNKYSDTNATKAITDVTHIANLNNQYSVVEQNIDRVRHSNNLTYHQMVANTNVEIQRLKDMVKEYKNVEYIATSLRTKSFSDVKKDSVFDLNNFETTVKRSKIIYNQLKSEIDTLKTTLNNATDKSSLVTYLNQLDAVKSKFSAIKNAERNSDSNTNKQISYYTKIMDNLKQIYSLRKKLINAGEEETNEINKQIKLFEQRNSYNKSQLRKKNLTDNDYEAQVNDLDNLLKLQLELNTARAKDTTNKNNAEEAKKELALRQKINLELSKLNLYESQNTKVFSSMDVNAKNLAQRFYALREAIANCGDGDELKGLTTQMKIIQNQIKANGLNGLSFFSELKNDAKKIFNWFVSGNFLMTAIRSIKKSITTVIELDDAMISLKKVCEATDKQFESFFKSATASAVELGASITDVINATADFARLGYGLDDASKLAEIATLYKNVGDGITIDDASSSIVSTMKAFNIEAENAITIIDKFNEVGNKFAISSSGIGESLSKSASALYEANNTLSESIALTVGANDVAQDVDAVGNMWKTVSMRIRGAKTELEEAGEDTDGLVTSTSRLQNIIKSMTGFDILEDDQETFKSTYDIIVGIGKVYNQLSDVNQASLLEMLAGKRQGNILASALNNIEDIQKAYETAESSTGSALKEQERLTSGITYSINQFKAKLQEISSMTIDSSFVKGVVDFGIAVEDVIIKVGGLQNLLISVIALFTANKLGIISKVIAEMSVAFTKACASMGAFNIASLTASIKIQGLSKTILAIGTALKTVFLSHPWITGILATITAVTALVTIINKVNNSTDETYKKLSEKHEDTLNKVSELSEEFETQKTTIEELNDTMKDNSDKLAELYKLRAKGKINESELSYIDTLEAQNQKLKTQIEYQETLANIKNKELEDESVKALNEKTAGSYYSDGFKFEYGDAVVGNNGLYTDIERIEKYNKKIELINKNLINMEKIQSGYSISDEDKQYYQSEYNKYLMYYTKDKATQEKYDYMKQFYKSMIDGSFTSEDYKLYSTDLNTLQQSFITENSKLYNSVSELNNNITSTTGANAELKKSINDTLNISVSNQSTYSTYLDAINGNAVSLNKVLDITKSKLNDLSNNGNVNLTNRPLVDSSTMQNAGYKVNDNSYSTVYSDGKFVWQGDEENGKYVYVHFTPILPDGTVLTSEEIANYIDNTLTGAEDILFTDNLKKRIVLKVDDNINVTESEVDNYQKNNIQSTNIANILSDANLWDKGLHQLQLEYYNIIDNIVNYSDNAMSETYNSFEEYLADITDNSESSLDSTIKDFYELVSSGSLTEESIKDLSEYNDVLSWANGNVQKLIIDIKKYFGTIDYGDLMSGLEDSLSDVLTAEKELNDNNVISYSTMQKILTEYPDLVNYITAVTGGYTIENNALENIITNKLNNYELDSQNAMVVAQKVLEAQGVQASSYEATTSSVKDLLKAKIALLKADNQNYVKPTNLKTLRDNLKTKTNQGLYNSSVRQETGIISNDLDIYQNNLANIKTLENALKDLENADTNYSNAQEIIEQLRNSIYNSNSGSGSGSNSSSSSSSEKTTKDFSETIDWIDTKYKNLEQNVSNLNTIYSNTDGYKNQLNAIKDLISAQEDLQTAYKNGVNIYDNYFNTEMNKLSKLGLTKNQIKEYINKIKNGEIIDKDSLQSFIDTNISSDDTGINEKIYDILSNAISYWNQESESNKNYIQLKYDIDSNQELQNQIQHSLDMQSFEIKINNLTTANNEIDTISSIYDNTTAFDEFGKITNNGASNLALLSLQLKNAQESASTYKDEINMLNDELLNGIITQDEYDTNIETANSNYLSSIKSIQSIKNSIIDLISKGINAETTAYSNQISTIKELLNKKNDLDDKNKSVAEKQEQLAILQRQINALSLDDSNVENNATRIKLEKEYADLTEELNKEIASNELETTQDSLDKQEEDFKNAQDKKLEDLKNNLSSQENELSKYLNNISINYENVFKSILETASSYGIEISQTLSNSINSVLTSFTSNGVSSVLTTNTSGTTQTALTKLNQYVISKGYNKLSWDDMVNLSNALGLNYNLEDIKSSGSIRMAILEALKKAGFSSGGLIEATGEDGIALVKHGEYILNQDTTSLLREFSSNLYPLKNILDNIKLVSSSGMDNLYNAIANKDSDSATILTIDNLLTVNGDIRDTATLEDVQNAINEVPTILGNYLSKVKR